MSIVSGILAVTLVSSARNLIGKGWLVATTVIWLLTGTGSFIISLIAKHSDHFLKTISWSDVFTLFYLFATACFGLFLLSNWAQSRMKFDAKNLLFSFSGRIPRSAFWISMCILFPLFTIVGAFPFITKAEGLPLAIIWIVYTISLILSTWVALAVYTKRWHDCSKSGWMSLIMLIPVVGLFWFFGYLGFVRGTQGLNQYGDNPLNKHMA